MPRPPPGGLALTQSPAYLFHRGRPAVIVWGLGFNDDGHPATPSTAAAIQSYFAAANVTLIGGVPTGWRTLTGDARPEPAWTAVYLGFAVIHPWLVGRFPDDAGAGCRDLTPRPCTLYSPPLLPLLLLLLQAQTRSTRARWCLTWPSVRRTASTTSPACGLGSPGRTVSGARPQHPAHPPPDAPPPLRSARRHDALQPDTAPERGLSVAPAQQRAGWRRRPPRDDALRRHV